MGTGVELQAASDAGTDRFYANMALLCVAVAFVGFAPTYFVPMAKGTFQTHPIVHIHGWVFFAWTLFFAYQARLAAVGNLARHRRVGLIGVALASVMTLLGFLIAIDRMHFAASLGAEEAAKAFALVPISSIVFFAALIIWAIMRASQPDWHKRLMLVATISILDAAIARWFLVLLAPPGPAGPPPVGVDVGPALVTCLLIAACIVRDLRKERRAHPAYLWSGSILLAIKLGQVPLSATAAWRSIAGGIMALTG